MPDGRQYARALRAYFPALKNLSDDDAAGLIRSTLEGGSEADLADLATELGRRVPRYKGLDVLSVENDMRANFGLPKKVPNILKPVQETAMSQYLAGDDSGLTKSVEKMMRMPYDLPGAIRPAPMPDVQTVPMPAPQAVTGGSVGTRPVVAGGSVGVLPTDRENREIAPIPAHAPVVPQEPDFNNLYRMVNAMQTVEDAVQSLPADSGDMIARRVIHNPKERQKIEERDAFGRGIAESRRARAEKETMDFLDRLVHPHPNSIVQPGEIALLPGVTSTPATGGQTRYPGSVVQPGEVAVLPGVTVSGDRPVVPAIQRPPFSPNEQTQMAANAAMRSQEQPIAAGLQSGIVDRTQPFGIPKAVYREGEPHPSDVPEFFLTPARAVLAPIEEGVRRMQSGIRNLDMAAIDDAADLLLLTNPSTAVHVGKAKAKSLMRGIADMGLGLADVWIGTMPMVAGINALGSAAVPLAQKMGEKIGGKDAGEAFGRTAELAMRLAFGPRIALAITGSEYGQKGVKSLLENAEWAQGLSDEDKERITTAAGHALFFTPLMVGKYVRPGGARDLRETVAETAKSAKEKMRLELGNILREGIKREYTPEEMKAVYHRVNRGTASAEEEALVRAINEQIVSPGEAVRKGTAVAQATGYGRVPKWLERWLGPVDTDLRITLRNQVEPSKSTGVTDATQVRSDQGQARGAGRPTQGGEGPGGGYLQFPAEARRGAGYREAPPEIPGAGKETGTRGLIQGPKPLQQLEAPRLPEMGQAEMRRFMATQIDILQKAGIPEERMPDYAQDSTADGKKLRTYAEQVIAGEITPDDAARRVRANFNKMIEGEKPAPALEQAGAVVPEEPSKQGKIVSTPMKRRDYVLREVIEPLSPSGRKWNIYEKETGELVRGISGTTKDEAEGRLRVNREVWNVEFVPIESEAVPASKQAGAVELEKPQLKSLQEMTDEELNAGSDRPKPGAKKKEPWEMTYKEVKDALDDLSDGSAEAWRSSPIVQAFAPNDPLGRPNYPGLSRRHREYLKQAQKEGKSIPAEALSDYPDLVKPAPVEEAKPKESVQKEWVYQSTLRPIDHAVGPSLRKTLIRYEGEEDTRKGIYGRAVFSARLDEEDAKHAGLELVESAEEKPTESDTVDRLSDEYAVSIGFPNLPKKFRDMHGIQNPKSYREDVGNRKAQDEGYEAYFDTPPDTRKEIFSGIVENLRSEDFSTKRYAQGWLNAFEDAKREHERAAPKQTGAVEAKAPKQAEVVNSEAPKPTAFDIEHIQWEYEREHPKDGGLGMGWEDTFLKPVLKKLAKGGWINFTDLAVERKDQQGHHTEPAQEALKWLRDKGYVQQAAWDRRGRAHFAKAGEVLPVWLSQSKDRAVVEGLINSPAIDAAASAYDPAKMRYELNVPYGKRNLAKHYGAKWDAGVKKWFYYADEQHPDRFPSQLEQFLPKKSPAAQPKAPVEASAAPASARAGEAAGEMLSEEKSEAEIIPEVPEQKSEKSLSPFEAYVSRIRSKQKRQYAEEVKTWIENGMKGRVPTKPKMLPGKDAREVLETVEKLVRPARIGQITYAGERYDVFAALDGMVELRSIRKNDAGDPAVVRKLSMEEYRSELSKREKASQAGRERLEGKTVIPEADLVRMPHLRAIWGHTVADQATKDLFEGVFISNKPVGLSGNTNVLSWEDGKNVTSDAAYERWLESDDPEIQRLGRQMEAGDIRFTDVVDKARDEIMQWERGFDEDEARLQAEAWGLDYDELMQQAEEGIEIAAGKDVDQIEGDLKDFFGGQEEPEIEYPFEPSATYMGRALQAKPGLVREQASSKELSELPDGIRRQLISYATNLYELGYRSEEEMRHALEQRFGGKAGEFARAVHRAVKRAEQTIDLDRSTSGGTRRPGIVLANGARLPVPRDVVPAGRYGTELDEHQRLGVNMALSRFEQPDGVAFGLFDGQGTGKTRIILTTAAEWAGRTGKPALIVAPNRQVIEQTYFKDAEALDVSFDSIEIGTYDDLRLGKIGQDEYSVAIFDESHFLKNVHSIRSHAAEAVRADRRMFATGTPMDRPVAASYFLSKLTGQPENVVQRMLGYEIRTRTLFDGTERRYAVTLEGYTWPQVWNNIKALRNRMIEQGAMIRREFPFYGGFDMVRTPMNPHDRSTQNEIDAYWQRRIASARSKEAKRNLAGQRIGELSRWNESLKINETMALVNKELEAGRSVVVVAESVNPSQVKALDDEEVPGFLTVFADRLKASGVTHARIYGSNNKAREIQMFQSNRARVALMTPQSGGTGVSLDDTQGTAPRTMIIVTSNWSGDLADQMLYRISRRNTATPAKIIHLTMDESLADQRRAEVVETKIRTLEAIQRGDDPDDAVGFDAEDSAEAEMGLAGLSIEQYTDRSIIVKGDTYPLRERFKALKDKLGVGIWSPVQKGWIFPLKYVDQVTNEFKDVLGDGSQGILLKSDEPLDVPIDQMADHELINQTRDLLRKEIREPGTIPRRTEFGISKDIISDEAINGFLEKHDIKDPGAADQLRLGFDDVFELTGTPDYNYRRSKQKRDLHREPSSAISSEEEAREKRQVELSAAALRSPFYPDVWRSVFAESDRASSLVLRYINGEKPNGDWFRGYQIRNAADFASVLMALRSRYAEMLKVAWLDDQNRIIDLRIVSLGTVNASIVTPREIFTNRPKGTNRCIVSHNHPSGTMLFSREDYAVTRDVLSTARLLGVEVIDHVVTDGGQYISMLGMEDVQGYGSIKIDPSVKPIPPMEDKAKWEALPTRELVTITGVEDMAPVVRALRQADAAHGHAIIMLNSGSIARIVRFPLPDAGESVDWSRDLAKNLLEQSYEEGAIRLILDMPFPAARVLPIVRNISKNIDGSTVVILDVASSDEPSFATIMHELIQRAEEQHRDGEVYRLKNALSKGMFELHEPNADYGILEPREQYEMFGPAPERKPVPRGETPARPTEADMRAHLDRAKKQLEQYRRERVYIAQHPAEDKMKQQRLLADVRKKVQAAAGEVMRLQHALNKGLFAPPDMQEGMFEAREPEVGYRTGGTDAPEFKRWFKGSKVVDKNGKPLVVYHGTQRSQFDEFRRMPPGFIGGSGHLTADLGFWFSEESSVANEFAVPRWGLRVPSESSPGVYPVFLVIRNPKVYDGLPELMDAIGERNSLSASGARNFRKQLIADGYDGIILARSQTDFHTARQDYIVFSPTQIKSATGNRGTYDPNDPNILHEPVAEYGVRTREIKHYQEQLEKFEKAELEEYELLDVGRLQGVSWENSGIDVSRPIKLTQGVVRKVTGKDHAVPMDVIRRLPELLDNPVIVGPSRSVTGKIVAVINAKDNNGQILCVIVDPDKSMPEGSPGAVIPSIYGRPVGQYKNWIETGWTPTYTNTALFRELFGTSMPIPRGKKVKRLPGAKGLQLPQLRTDVLTEGNIQQSEGEVNRLSPEIENKVSGWIRESKGIEKQIERMRQRAQTPALQKRISKLEDRLLELWGKIEGGTAPDEMRMATGMPERQIESDAMQFILQEVPKSFVEHVDIDPGMRSQGGYNPITDEIRIKLQNGTAVLHELGHRFFLRYAPADLHNRMLGLADKMDRVIGRKAADEVRKNYPKQEWGFEMEAEMFRQVSEKKEHAWVRARAFAGRIFRLFPEKFKKWGIQKLAEAIFGAYRMAQRALGWFGRAGARERAVVADFLAGKSGMQKHQPAARRPMPRLSDAVMDRLAEHGSRIWSQGKHTSNEFADELISTYGEEIRPYVAAVYRATVAKLSKGNPQLGMFERDIALPAETRMQKFIRVFQDRFSRILQAQTSIERAGGRVIAEEAPYLKEELHYGKIEKRLEDFEESHVKPLANALAEAKKEGIEIEDVVDYLYAVHAPDRNRQIAKINPDMPDGGSGMTDEEAASVLDALKADGKLGPKMDAVAKAVWSINKAARDIIRGNLESEETVAAWEDAYGEHYVPLKSGEADHLGSQATGTGFSVSRSGVRRALGRRSRAEDLVENTISQYVNAVIRDEKNRVGQAFLNMVIENPDRNLWEVNKVPMKRVLTHDGIVMRVPDWKGTFDDRFFRVTEGGKVVFVEIKDPVLARQLKRLYEGDLVGEWGRAIVNSLGAFTRYVVMINTAKNPEFMFVNFVRDAQTAGINIGADKLGKITGTVAKSLPRAIAGITSAEFADGKGEWATWYKRYKESGAKVAFFKHDPIADIRRNLMARVKMATSTRGQNIRRHPFLMLGRPVLQAIEKLNAAIENGVRLSTFRALVESGAPEPVAASYAKNLTVNFNRKGEIGPVLNAMWAFSNASIQGTARMAQAVKGPYGKRIAAGLFLFGLLGAELQRLLAGEDEIDGRNRYDKLESWVKDSHLIFFINDDRYIKVPLPYGLGIFYGVGAEINSVLHGKPVISKPGEKEEVASGALSDFFSTVLTNLNPLGSGPMSQVLSPTAFEPAVQSYTNENFFGAPIRPQENPYESPGPSSERFFESARPVSRTLARQANELTGGSEFRSGWVDISPNTLDFWWDFITGGAGKTVMNTITTVSNLARGERTPVENIPVMRRFVGKEKEGVIRERFYSLFDEQRQLQAELDAMMERNTESGKVESWRRENDTFMRFVDALGSLRYTSASGETRAHTLASVQRVLGGIRKAERAAREAKEYDEANRLRREQTDLMKQVIGIYNKVAQETEGVLR